MKLNVLVPTVAMLLLTTGAAMSAPLYCVDHRPNFEGLSDREGGSAGFGPFQDDPEVDRNQRDLIALRQRGFDAIRVERWNGCIRAFIRQPNGVEGNQFFDPNNYREIPVG